MGFCRWVAVSCFVSFITLFSCNLFEPRKPIDDKYYMSAEAWVVEGKKRMWEERWAEAVQCFDKAISKKNSLSEAYFYRGKCYLRMHDVDLNHVWDEIKPSANPEDSNRVPFLFKPPAGVSIKAPIAPFCIVLNGQQYQADTLIDSVFLQRKRVYDAVSKAIKDLEIIHTSPHMDGVIKRQQYESDYLVEISVKVVLGIVDLNNNEKLDYHESATATLSDERKAFMILCQDIPSLTEMNLDSLKTISKNPRDINAHLDSILTMLSKADESYNKFKKDLDSGAAINNNLDTGMASGVGTMIKNFNTTLPYFYYDDFRDNDNDRFNTNGNDTVKIIDGKPYIVYERMIWIDWDYDDRIDIYSPQDTSVNGHLHIGDSIHAALNLSLYELVDSTDKDYLRYRYKGGYTYEFIGGDWGVDEEIVDGVDNDGDGLIDEDTRIVGDTIDDDGDYVNTNTDAVVQPMIWTVTGLYDSIIEIDTVSNHWQRVPLKTSYWQFHKDDYPKHYGKAIPDSVSIYAVTGSVAYTGDFQSGDYGCDEEWFDGIDNDQDGLIDEDVGEKIPPPQLRDQLIFMMRKLGERGYRQ